MSERRSAPAEKADSTWIGKDTLLEGKLTTKADICIRGRLNGAVESRGSLLVPEGGEVDADILARTVAIHGRVHGKVEAVETAEIGASGTLIGEILAATVVIEAGATFEGTVRSRASQAAEPAASPKISPKVSPSTSPRISEEGA